MHPGTSRQPFGANGMYNVVIFTEGSGEKNNGKVKGRAAWRGDCNTGAVL